jgi:glycosyltransferase involved in cell wall biosynthesis
MTNSTELSSGSPASALDVVCFSHLRWDFVFQRPQHLMTRFARDGRVFVIEEPVQHEGDPFIDISPRGANIFVCTPHISGLEDERMPRLVKDLIAENGLVDYIAWFYTPMMLEWSRDLEPQAIVYDCMDELSAFKGAPPELMERERELFRTADVVFTGGQSLYEAKKDRHRSVHAFPSSIDTAHFGRAREISEDFADQTGIEHPRVGFVGVIDERTDIGLLNEISDLRPEWNFVMVGPVVKISEEDLPRSNNIHYLGQRSYDDLPAILSGWDVAMMPFALNESTKYISPTKTPEYLAAGLPVVSTRITDVVTPYGDIGLVHIADSPQEFVSAIEKALGEDAEKRLPVADEFLARNSWDKTFDQMRSLIADAIKRRETAAEAAA